MKKLLTAAVVVAGLALAGCEEKKSYDLREGDDRRELRDDVKRDVNEGANDVKRDLNDGTGGAGHDHEMGHHENEDRGIDATDVDRKIKQEVDDVIQSPPINPDQNEDIRHR